MRDWLVRLTGRQPVIVSARSRIGAKFAARAMFDEDIDCYAEAVPIQLIERPSEPPPPIEPRPRGRPRKQPFPATSFVINRSF